MTPTRYGTSDFAGAAARHIELIKRATDSTERIMSSILDWVPEGLESELAARADLLSQIANSSRELRQMADRLPSSDTAGLAAEIDRMQSTLAKKQQECETLLAAEMLGVETELISLNRGRGLRAAYGRIPEAEVSRFIDSRL